MKYVDNDIHFIFIGLIIGILIGEVLTMCMARIVTRNAVGFGIEVADDIINNPKVSIDTTYTIYNQDTISTYHFVKNK